MPFKIGLGTQFLQGGQNPNPYYDAAQILEETYSEAFEMYSAALLFQAGASQLFEPSTATYDAAAGTFTGDLDLSEDAIGDLAAVAPPTSTNEYWLAIVSFLDHTKGLDNLTVDEVSWLDASITYRAGLNFGSDSLRNVVGLMFEGIECDDAKRIVELMSRTRLGSMFAF